MIYTIIGLWYTCDNLKERVMHQLGERNLSQTFIIYRYELEHKTGFATIRYVCLSVALYWLLTAPIYPPQVNVCIVDMTYKRGGHCLS